MVQPFTRPSGFLWVSWYQRISCSFVSQRWGKKSSVGEEIIFAGEKEREKAEEWKREAGGWRDGREGENTKGVY